MLFERGRGQHPDGRGRGRLPSPRAAFFARTFRKMGEICFGDRGRDPSIGLQRGWLLGAGEAR